MPTEETKDTTVNDLPSGYRLLSYINGYTNGKEYIRSIGQLMKDYTRIIGHSFVPVSGKDLAYIFMYSKSATLSDGCLGLGRINSSYLYAKYSVTGGTRNISSYDNTNTYIFNSNITRFQCGSSPDNLVRDLVACDQGSSATAGMFDLIGGTKYGPYNGVKFSSGISIQSYRDNLKLTL